MTTHSFLSSLSRSAGLCRVDRMNGYKSMEYAYTREKLIYQLIIWSLWSIDHTVWSIDHYTRDGQKVLSFVSKTLNLWIFILSILKYKSGNGDSLNSSFINNLKHSKFVASNKGFYNSNTFHFSHFCKT